MTAPPRLTIGMPAYNNAGTIRASVESLLAQRFGDFRLVISDDRSPDDTAAVCAELAKLDRRIEYVRQPVNLKYQNFGWLLREAKTEYFMWAAGDDHWYPDFARACIAELDRDPGLVLAAPRIEFGQDRRVERLSDGTYPLQSPDVAQNVARYLRHPGDNSRMYGVFRTAPAKQCFPATSFHAYDWAFSAATLRFGRHAEIPEVLMYRDQTALERYHALARADGRSALARVFPVLGMSCWLLAENRIPRTRRVLAHLLALNLNKHFEYTGHFHPTYSALAGPLERVWRRQLEWRLTRGTAA